MAHARPPEVAAHWYQLLANIPLTNNAKADQALGICGNFKCEGYIGALCSLDSYIRVFICFAVRITDGRRAALRNPLTSPEAN